MYKKDLQRSIAYGKLFFLLMNKQYAENHIIYVSEIVF